MLNQCCTRQAALERQDYELSCMYPAHHELQVLLLLFIIINMISAAGDYDPCVDNEVEIYFNRPEVQKAMHANTTGMPGPWVDCNPNIAYSM